MAKEISLEILIDLLYGFYLYSVCKSTSIIDHFLMNINIQVQNIVALQIIPPKRRWKFS
jgi:hypothetical protein